jgi:hypothetical protein
VAGLKRGGRGAARSTRVEQGAGEWSANSAVLDELSSQESCNKLSHSGRPDP